MNRSKITLEMAEACYKYAKDIYPHKEKIYELAKRISEETEMKKGSAIDYINCFFNMIVGTPLVHDMSERDIRCYFKNIENDYGDEILRKALKSLQLYLINEKQNHPGLQKLLNEYYQDFEV